MRTPDEILADFERGCNGQVDMYAILWEIIDDILDSVALSIDNGNTGDEILITVSDYVANNYGENSEPCNTCGGTGRWTTTLEDDPTTLVDIGPCPDCALGERR